LHGDSGPGPGAPPLSAPTAELARLSELEQAEYFAATRQFDRAVIHFENGLKDPAWAKAHSARWNDAIQKLLAIVVRVRKSPSLSMEMVSRFLDTASYPRELAGAARLWRGHLKEWRAEAPGSESMESASRLIERADALVSRGDPHAGFVLYLRASSILHERLAVERASRERGRMLYLAGVASQALKDTNFWALPEELFRACAEEGARKETEWTRKCRARTGDGKEAAI
jgi:hypothetical protein